MQTSNTSLPDPSAGVRRGLVLMILGSLFIPGLDAAAKLLVDRHGLPVGEIAFARFVLQSAMVLPFLLVSEGLAGLRVPDLGLNLFRGILLSGGTFLFFLALKFMPLADATAIFFVEPMIVTLLSALVLKEPLDARRVGAVLVGFVGALIVIRPNFVTLGAVAVLPALTALCVAGYAILSRRLSQGTSPLAMHFYAGIGGGATLLAVLLGGLAFPTPELAIVVPSGVEVWSLILAVGVFATVCHLMFIHAYRLTPASLLAPLGYIEIVSATWLGLLLFGDFPDAAKCVGMAVIVVSGAYIVWRENAKAGSVPLVPEQP